MMLPAASCIISICWLAKSDILDISSFLSEKRGPGSAKGSKKANRDGSSDGSSSTDGSFKK